MKIIMYYFLLIGLFIFGYAAYAVEVGDKAPVFNANDDQGNLWKSSDYVGKNYLVVYFYPAAMTGGCTKQACSFRDNKATLKDEGIEVGE